MTYRLNPAWCVAARFNTTDPSGLRVGDIAIILKAAGEFAILAPSRAHTEPFEGNLKRALVADLPSEPYVVDLSVSQMRREFEYRTKADVVEAVARLRPARNVAGLLFSDVRVTDDRVSLRLATGPSGLVSAHPFHARRIMRPTTRRAGDAPYADRSYTLVDPRLASSFGSASSAHAYLRLRTWLTSPCRNGLPHQPMYDYGEDGSLTARIPPAQVVERLGVTVARSSVSYVKTALGRVFQDLLMADIDVRYAPPVISRRYANGLLTARIASATPFTTEERRDHGDSSYADKPPFPTRGLPLDRTITRAAVSVERVVDEQDEEVVMVTPTPIRPGRVRLRVVPSADDVARSTDEPDPAHEVPMTSAANDDDHEHEHDDEDPGYTPDPDAEVVDEPAPVRAHVQPDASRYPTMEDRLAADPQPMPGIYAPGTAPIHPGYGREPTDRDRYTPALGRPMPPGSTPWRIADRTAWCSVPHDALGRMETEWPLLVWVDGCVEGDQPTAVRDHKQLQDYVIRGLKNADALRDAVAQADIEELNGGVEPFE